MYVMLCFFIGDVTVTATTTQHFQAWPRVWAVLLSAGTQFSPVLLNTGTQFSALLLSAGTHCSAMLLSAGTILVRWS